MKYIPEHIVERVSEIVDPSYKGERVTDILEILFEARMSGVASVLFRIYKYDENVYKKVLSDLAKEMNDQLGVVDENS